MPHVDDLGMAPAKGLKKKKSKKKKVPKADDDLDVSTSNTTKKVKTSNKDEGFSSIVPKKDRGTNLSKEKSIKKKHKKLKKGKSEESKNVIAVPQDDDDREVNQEEKEPNSKQNDNASEGNEEELSKDTEVVAKEQEPKKPKKKVTFKSLGLDDVLCDACTAMGYKAPSEIQAQSIPYALQGNDIIGLAETGSGKTAAFALPVLQSLLNATGKRGLYCLVLTPTRELAFGIRDCFDALGAGIDLRTAVVVGGIDIMTQAIALSKKPHVIIATPGRIVDHLENTKGFHLKTLKYLIMDEADRILNMDFEKEVDQLLRCIPQERNTFLFSATMTSKVAKLQRASLKNPVKVEVSTKYKTVDTLSQRYVFIPEKYKDCYLAYILNEMRGNSFMVFCSTCANTERTTLMLRALGFDAICLHGQMSQPKRLGALAKYTAQKSSILLATDVASRGLDISHVDCVINFDIPMHSKDYIHRVGRTARAGRSGVSVTFVTQYNVELFQRIEKLTGKKMDLHPCEEPKVLQFLERVSEAQRAAVSEMRAIKEKKNESRNRDGGGGGKRKRKQK